MEHVRVIVIGGGATGTGILRDLSMRGIPALLLEKADLASGTSSRFHGLLHSGARYAVNDPDAARECITENMILRRIGTSCVEKTEGYFVRTPEDDPAFESLWVNACRECGIDVREVPLSEALLREPGLCRDARAVYRVPDSAVDGFRLVWHNVMSARRYGGDIRTYCTVTGIESKNGAVTGVSVVHTKTGQKETIPCDFVINATGSWAGEVAHLAGLSVAVTPDRGTLLAFNHRFTTRVVNRLRKPTDGDIFVPHGSITIFGTTSVPTDRPDDTRPRSEDVRELLQTGEALFPKIHEYRMLRAFAGTRPLYSPDASTGRSATRNFVIIDHEHDGLKGMITITGGKFTSYRLMAEKAVDVAASRLGVTAPCRTAIESIVPDPDENLLRRAKNLFPSEGSRLAIARLGDDLEKAVTASEQEPWKKLLLCECEMVTLAEFETVASEETSHSLGDIRRRTRLGMGTCQGSFCALRATGALVENALLPHIPPQHLFRQFVQERWQGIRPLLWGTQIREIQLERGIYDATLNLNGDPDIPYAPPLEQCPPLTPKTAPSLANATLRTSMRTTGEYDVIVAGAGFSGLTAAATAAARGKRVLVITKGAGALTIGGGTIDLLGYVNGSPVEGNPFAAMRTLPERHPYRILGEEKVRDSLDFLAELLAAQNATMLLAGSETTGNAWLPTAAGTMKPSWITSAGMNPCAIIQADAVTVLGVTGMKDFSAVMTAAGLKNWPQFLGKTVTHESVASPFANNSKLRDLTALDLASFLDTEEGLEWLARSISSLRTGADTVLLPSILGTKPNSAAHSYLEGVTGKKIVELFCPPPSVTGLRMHHVLMAYLRGKGVDFVENATIVDSLTEKGRCNALVTRLPDKERTYRADSFIIATGGLFGGGIVTGQGKAMETVFHIPLAVPAVQDEWSSADFFAKPHPFAYFGVPTDERLSPVDAKGRVLFANVHFVGRTLGGYDFASEKSGSGVALATGHFAGLLTGSTTGSLI
ncbi:MAG: Anaerobic glycerol-3-phosphate dehydrogenase subunit B [Desulfovibrio sp.]